MLNLNFADDDELQRQRNVPSRHDKPS
jgi:hypothetical protein